MGVGVAAAAGVVVAGVVVTGATWVDDVDAGDGAVVGAMVVELVLVDRPRTDPTGSSWSARSRRLPSVPENTVRTDASSSAGGRMMRGVIDSTISVLTLVPLLLPKSLPTTGRCPSPGTLAAVLRSSAEISPPRTWVSPSRRRRTVCALRVPIW